jgi:choloylglycine hydrolase
MGQKPYFSKILLLIVVCSSITTPNISSYIISKMDMNIISSSCTIFTVSIGDTVYFGNNEDYLQRDLYQWYIPSQNISLVGENRSIYGAVFVGYINRQEGGIYPQGGMNEHGLMYDFNGLPALPIDVNPTGLVVYTDYILCASLWDCKNVEEVIQWFKDHKWDLVMGGQIHYGDASGDAVVISVDPITSKWAFTRKNSSYLVSTNFNLNNSNNGDYPCQRYNTAVQMLNEIENEEELTIQACADVLYAVHQEGESHTLYSNIFDPINLDTYFNFGNNYQNQRKVSLLDTLSQKASYERKDSFFGITGTDGYLLVKPIRINDNYYSSTPPALLYIITISAASIISIPLGFLILHKKKKKKIILKSQVLLSIAGIPVFNSHRVIENTFQICGVDMVKF